MKRLLLGMLLVAVAVAPAVAEPTWKLDAHETTYSYVCGGNDWIAINGSGNTVTVTGECAILEVTGSDNRIAIEAVGTIRLSGDNNDVRYGRATGGKKKPVIKRKGAANTVRKAE
jgi:hypothetical protein